MKELKILAVVVFFSLLTYWLVEPYAHSQMHKHVEGHNFVYDGTADIQETAKKYKEKKEAFWADVKNIAALKGNVQAGEAGFAMCMGCHNGSNTNMGGVIPPNLDHAGALYSKHYLIALIKDPAIAMNVDHKYVDTMTHPMGSVKTMFTDKQSIADVVAYVMSKKAGEITPKEAFSEACMRCHAMRYSNMTQLGLTPKFKHEKDALAHKMKVLDEQDLIKKYMGKTPPDLSMMIRARSEDFMKTFVENPQSQLPGTSMPRVGLTREGYEKVKTYLEEVGDSSKAKRAAIGPWVLLFFFIFTILAYLWKKEMWKGL